MAQARGRASRAADPSEVHETLGLKVQWWPRLRHGPQQHAPPTPTPHPPFVYHHIFQSPPLISPRFFISVTFTARYFFELRGIT